MPPEHVCDAGRVFCLSSSTDGRSFTLPSVERNILCLVSGLASDGVGLALATDGDMPATATASERVAARFERGGISQQR
jgi:hypothetical protein